MRSADGTPGTKGLLVNAGSAALSRCIPNPVSMWLRQGPPLKLHARGAVQQVLCMFEFVQ